MTHFGFTLFYNHRVNNDGTFTCLSYPIDIPAYFFTLQDHKHDPYMRSPKHVKEGLSYFTQQDFPGIDELNSYLQGKSNICTNIPALVIKDEDGYDLYNFGGPLSDAAMSTILINQLPLLKKYISYYKESTKGLVKQIWSQPVDLKESLGDLFDQPFDFNFGDNSLCPETFFDQIGESGKHKKIKSLSNREKQLLKLFFKGETAASTGRILGLTKRTVEFYFENIKNKLTCLSKGEIREHYVYDFSLISDQITH